MLYFSNWRSYNKHTNIYSIYDWGIQHMAAKVSYTSYDYKDISIVPVIVSFDTKGRIVPLYVRIAGESYRIDSFYVQKRFESIFTFCCQLIVGDCLKPLQLTYYKEEDVWGIAASTQSLF